MKATTFRHVLPFVLTTLAALLVCAGVVSAFSFFCGSHLDKINDFWTNPNNNDGVPVASQRTALQLGQFQWNKPCSANPGQGGASYDSVWRGDTAVQIVSLTDGINSMHFRNINAGGALAATYCNGVSVHAGWDIRFFDGGNVFRVNGQAWDIQGVACHEAGHSLGLGHSQAQFCSGACALQATMCPAACGTGFDLRTIAQDDKNGIQAIYGAHTCRPPSITGFNPSQGQAFGGETIAASGSGFTGTTSVTLDGIPVPSFTVVNDVFLTFTTPLISSSLGPKQVVVTNPLGSGSAALQIVATQPPRFSTPSSVMIGALSSWKVGDDATSGRYSVMLSAFNGPTSLGPLITVDIGGGLARNIFFLPLLPLSSAGTHQVSFQIPNDMNLAGTTWYSQALFLNFGDGSLDKSTDVVQIMVN